MLEFLELGKNNPVFKSGVIEKIRAGNIGKTISPETSKRMSLSRAGKHWTEKQRVGAMKANAIRKQNTMDSRNNCRMCGNKVKGKYNQFCSLECQHKAMIGNTFRNGKSWSDKTRELHQLNSLAGKPNLKNRGKIPWNKGLTKETDFRVISTPVFEKHKDVLRLLKTGKPRTELVKQKVSVGIKSAYLNGSLVPPAHASRGIVSKYWSKYQDKFVTFRSSYERRYAEWLDKNNVVWEYESKRFNLGDTTYCPDFHLIDSNCWIEVKGYWYESALHKFELFRKMYPDIQISVVDKMLLDFLVV